MSLASIQPILAVERHPNADSLDLVRVLGYTRIVKRDQWKVGDLCVFIEPDSVLPDTLWAAPYRAKSNRVKAIRLRNFWSFGIVESLSNVGLDPLQIPASVELVDMTIKAGVDVTEFLGVIKYDPPVPQDLAASGPYGFGIPKTDESRVQSLSPIDMPAWGTLVDITVKLDGQSWSAFCKLEPEPDGPAFELIQSFKVTRGVGGRSFLYKPDSDNNYTRNEKAYGVLNKLEAFCRASETSLCIRGEQYGHGIQKGAHNPHSLLPLSLAFYSTWLIDERRYARKGEPFYLYDIAAQLGLPTVPVIAKDVPLTPELIKYYAEGIDKVNGQAFKGVVIQWGLGSCKIINMAYDARK